MKVIVTGASGLLGRAVVKEFIDAEHEVVGIVYSRVPNDDAAKAVCKKCDLRDSEAFATICKDFEPDVIIHCAAERRPDRVAENPEAATEMNVR
jgi:S-adenosylmethionine synthetase